VQHVAAVLRSGRVVVSLHLIEGRVAPVRLVAGAQLPVPTGDLEVGVLHRRLTHVLVVELEQPGLGRAQQVHALTHADGVLLERGEDGIDEAHLPRLLPLPHLLSDGLNRVCFFEEEVEDGGLVDLL
jgi:hypothetical protein